MRSLRMLRSLLRVETRDIRRHSARSLLVVSLVAVPVAALTGGGALFRTTQPTIEERRATATGAADLRIDVADAAARRFVLASVPDDASVAVFAFERRELRTPAGVIRVARAERLDARGGPDGDESRRGPSIGGPSIGGPSIEDPSIEDPSIGHSSLGGASDRSEAFGVACPARGLLRIVAGRGPSRVGEVALSPSILEAFGASIGDTVHLAERSCVVTGAAVDPENLGRPVVVAVAAASEDVGGDGAGEIDRDGTPRASSVFLAFASGGGTNPVRVSADGPVPTQARARALAERLREAGHRVRERASIGGPDGFEALATFVVGGFGFFEAALVIAAAFAVGFRRRQRELGLLGASGAQGAHLCASALVASALLASVGIGIGIAVGTAAAFASHPFFDGWNGRWNGPLELSIPHAFGAALLGLVAALGAAAIPAVGATRQEIRVALGAKRPAASRAGGWLGVGIASLVLGFGVMGLGALGGDGHGSADANGGAAASGGLDGSGGRGEGEGRAGVAILVGSALGVLGFGAIAPWLLDALARLAAPLPLPWRLAVRDAGRFRARNGPVVAAVLAGMSISVLVAALAGSIAEAVGASGADAAPIAGAVRVVLSGCVATGLVVVWIATALSTVESAADARVLRAVGASPVVMRRLVAARAGYLAALGCALALPAGLVPFFGLRALADVPLAFAMPWTAVGIALVGLPATAYAIAGGWVALFGDRPRWRGDRAGPRGLPRPAT